MKIAVWDTYVKRMDGNVMHFDILVDANLEDKERIFEFGRNYLTTKNFSTEGIKARKCQFCHIEEATEEIKNDIETKGFFIIEMRNCE